jgi:hypothetical protein
VVLPLAATGPIPLILALSALLTAHVKTEDPPALTVDGAAENDVITGNPVEAAGGVTVVVEPLTVSTTVDLLVPFLLVAVSTYEVVAAGATLSEPVDGTAGMPGSILTEEALSTSHEIMAASPVLMAAGATVNFATEGSFLEAAPLKSIVTHAENASTIVDNNNTTRFIFAPFKCNLAVWQ